MTTRILANSAAMNTKQVPMDCVNQIGGAATMSFVTMALIVITAILLIVIVVYNYVMSDSGDNANKAKIIKYMTIVATITGVLGAIFGVIASGQVGKSNKCIKTNEY